MNDIKRSFSCEKSGKTITFELGKLAKQADGSVLVSSEGTQVLVTACSSDTVKEGQNFFPLLVEYTEKFYAVGKFLGGFIKREARPSTPEILTARLIDRSLRPLFPKGYMFDTVISCTVLSYAPQGDPEVLAALGASFALDLSDIPFKGSIGSCKVARINGEFVIDPDYDQWQNSDLEILISASQDGILMVEGRADMISEDIVLEAIRYGHEYIKDYIAFIEPLTSKYGSKKRSVETTVTNQTLMEEVSKEFLEETKVNLNIDDKIQRQKAFKILEKKLAASMKKSPERYNLTESSSFTEKAYAGIDELIYQTMRGDILNHEKRISGRALDEVRAITTETDLLNNVHGSSLFTRGETQVLSSVTIGGGVGNQIVDRIVGREEQSFYLHYNFPPYSVGESRGVRGVSRRELGHGHLAERALKAVLPSQDNFPYTMRVVCDVLESNGSSSMGSVCSASMALMDAGVPIKNPVAGIAMGLVLENTKYKILSDILGDEDHLGDMDFKVAGTENGITAIQMDIKIDSLSETILKQALEQAKIGRRHILKEMERTISTTRKKFKKGVPRIRSFKIKPDEIGLLIGPGGKNIKKLQEDFDVSIECMEDGTIKVLGLLTSSIEECIHLAELQIKGPQIGDVFKSKAITLKEYGVFVDIAHGISGLVHISEIAEERVQDIEDYISEGDQFDVKVLDVDKTGRVKLSAKAVQPLKRK